MLLFQIDHIYKGFYFLLSIHNIYDISTKSIKKIVFIKRINLFYFAFHVT